LSKKPHHFSTPSNPERNRKEEIECRTVLGEESLLTKGKEKAWDKAQW
jgi:hypothetical protein